MSISRAQPTDRLASSRSEYSSSQTEHASSQKRSASPNDATSDTTTQRDRLTRAAFTLIELLVVVAMIGLLLAILLPSLAAARAQARAGVCGSNIRQLAVANLAYATQSRGHFVLAAEDIFIGFGGTKRWHGQRRSAGVSPDPADNRFNPAKGPLAAYLGRNGEVKRCPAFGDYVEDGSWNSFEAGAGGYGYNATYIGGRADLYGTGMQAARNSARSGDVRRPADTVMFTDSAFVQPQPPAGAYLIEYTFCEPPLMQLRPGELPGPTRPTPSIHFRHRGRVNVAWADSHVDQRRLDFSASVAGLDEAAMRGWGVGWFGPTDNRLFDLK